MPAAAASRLWRGAAPWLCRGVGAAAAICLWGVGAEAVCFGYYLSGGFLLADALVVSFMESLFVVDFLASECGGADCQRLCSDCCRPFAAVDTYKRSILYTLLSVPCFVHYRQLWLPLLPGLLLLLAAVLHASRHCVEERGSAITKIPTFVRFDEDAESSPPQAARGPSLSHQSSFASGSDDSGTGQLGSRDSGIEASTKSKVDTVQQQQQQQQQAVDVKKSQRGFGRFGGGSSADRRCLLSDDELAVCTE